MTAVVASSSILISASSTNRRGRPAPRPEGLFETTMRQGYASQPCRPGEPARRAVGGRPGPGQRASRPELPQLGPEGAYSAPAWPEEPDLCAALLGLLGAGPYAPPSTKEEARRMVPV